MKSKTISNKYLKTVNKHNKSNSNTNNNLQTSLNKKLNNRSRIEETVNNSLKLSFAKKASKEKISYNGKDNRTTSCDGLNSLNKSNNYLSAQGLNMNDVDHESLENKKKNRNNSIALLDVPVNNLTDFYPNTTSNKVYSNSTFGKYLNNLAMKEKEPIKTKNECTTVNSSYLTANTACNSYKNTMNNKLIKTNKSLIINKLGGKVNISRDNILKFHNSLTISKDTEDDNPLSSSKKTKIFEIKEQIIHLINETENKNDKLLIIKELDILNKQILISLVGDKEEEEISLNSRNSQYKNKSPLTPHLDNDNDTLENSESIKRENFILKNKLENIDKKFEVIYSENNELRDYIKEKSENLDDMKTILYKLISEMNDLKKNKCDNKYSDQESLIMNTNESIDNVNYYTQLNLKKPNIPKLNFNNDNDDTNDSKEKTACFMPDFPKESKNTVHPEKSIDILNNINLNISNLRKSDFNDEFMEMYNEFSPSWRNEADKMNSRGKK